MLLDTGALQAPEPGAYRVWAGRPGGLREETANLARLVAGLAAGVTHAVTLLPAQEAGARWAGDPLQPRPLDPAGPAPGELELLTSGTTGVPKRVRRSPAARSSARPEPGAIWLLAYAPQRWAGLSVLLHAVATGARVAVPSTLDSGALVQEAQDEAVTHVSLTPSMLRKLLVQEGRERLAALPLRQVTFGGEAATQGVLDTAAELWPAARVTHVLATTETGDLCAASDGRAGFPPELLLRDGRTLSGDGELLVAGRPMGDLWQEQAGRLQFVGRRDEVINVGGESVSPLRVEEAAQALPGVRYARAFAVPSPLLGSLVALDFVGTADERELQRALRGTLPRAAAPARVRRVEAVELTEAGKTRRAAVE